MNKNVNVLKQNLSKELKNKTILVTGGAGSIGAQFKCMLFFIFSDKNFIRFFTWPFTNNTMIL